MGVIQICAKCGSRGGSGYNGLCESCNKDMEKAFRKANELDCDTKSEMRRKYNALSIEEAVVKKNFGPRKTESTCDSCGSVISDSQANSSRSNSRTDSELCKSCEDRSNKDLEKIRRKNRERFENL